MRNAAHTQEAESFQLKFVNDKLDFYIIGLKILF